MEKVPSSLSAVSRAKSKRGLTLLELLVTLALVAALTAILTQIAWQVARQEARAADVQQWGGLTRVLREQLRTALEAALPTTSSQDPQAMKGDLRNLTFHTSDSPLPGTLGLARLKLSLKFNPASGLTELWCSAAQEGVPAPTSWLVEEWPGNRGEIRYVDRDGSVLDRWPPEGQTFQTLPSTVLLISGTPEVPAWAARIESSSYNLPTRAELLAR